MHEPTIIQAIDTAPLNRGMSGAVWLASAGNVPVTFDNGDVALFEDRGEGDYEAHFLFVSTGKSAIEHGRAAFKIMFTQHNAKLVFGLVPDFRRDVKLFVRWIGAKFAGKKQTSEGLCELYVISNLMYFGKVN